MKRRFVILRLEEDPSRLGAKSPGETSPKLDVENLGIREALELERDPMIVALAPLMPIRLIKPVSCDSATSQEGGNWGIAAIEADQCPYDGRGVTVAVLDSGIDAGHLAFAGVQLTQKDFTGEGIADEEGHGTHCAGIIFGRDVEGVRIGVARGVERALIGKVLSKRRPPESEWLFRAMLWAMWEGADVISMSIAFDFPGTTAELVGEGWPPDLATAAALEDYRANLRMFDAIMGVLRANAAFGAEPLVVAAAGNASKRDLNAAYRIPASLPAAAEGVLSVGAIERRGHGYSVADFSNSKAKLSAPGVEILSAKAGGGLVTMSGTSMACPHVVGAAALWWEKLRGEGRRPNAQNIKAILETYANMEVYVEKNDTDTGGVVSVPRC